MKLSKENEMACNKLRTRQNRFMVRIKEILDEVKNFKSKDRMSEANDYYARLEAIQEQLDEFYKEVKCGGAGWWFVMWFFFLKKQFWRI